MSSKSKDHSTNSSSHMTTKNDWLAPMKTIVSPTTSNTNDNINSYYQVGNEQLDIERPLVYQHQASASPTTTHSYRRVGHKKRLSSIYRSSMLKQLDVVVECKKVNYTVGYGSSRKRILTDIDVKFTPNTLTAMMGPSGSGKTSLISCILGLAPGDVTGDILINGERGPQRSFKSVARLVPQEDVMYPSFTVRETFWFQAELCIGPEFTRQEKDERINAVITSLDLAKCADTRIGNVDERGISGGQRKRVSIGMELLTNPMVLCLDEPTSGLDSTSAENVVELLKMVSRSRRTVITTIHQPSWRIFQIFDHVVLLANGNLVYDGPMKRIEEHFLSIGCEIPAKENPIDAIMRSIQDPEFVVTAPEKFLEVRNKYIDDLEEQIRAEGITTPRLLANNEDDNTHDINKAEDYKELPLYPITFLKQTVILFYRTALDNVKDMYKFLMNLVVNLLVGLMIGLVWYKASNPPKQINLESIEGAILLCVMSGSIQTLGLTLITFPIVRSILLREYRNGSYSVFAFYVAQLMSLILFSSIYVLVMVVPLYFMVGFQTVPEKMFVFVLGMFLMTILGGAIGLVVGALSKDILQASMRLAPILAPLLLFSGYVIPYKDIPVYFRPFYWMSFFRVGICLFELNQFSGLEFVDFNLDIFHPLKIRPFKTGDQFLKEILGIDPEEESVWNYIGVLAGYASFCIFFGYFIVAREARRKPA